jgi:hypothetical protein
MGQPDHRGEKQSSNNYLRDVILGGQDGLVNMLGIALGVVAASGSTDILLGFLIGRLTHKAGG